MDQNKSSHKSQAESRPSTGRGGALFRAAQRVRTDDVERKTLRALGLDSELFRPYPYPELPPITVRSTGTAELPERAIPFKRLNGGQTVVDGEITSSALLSIYEALAREFKQMRILVKQHGTAGLTPDDLKKNFSDTEFARAADEADWRSVIDDIRNGATAKNMALVFLESKTGSSRQTIKSVCSRARQPRKRALRNYLQQ